MYSELYKPNINTGNETNKKMRLLTPLRKNKREKQVEVVIGQGQTQADLNVQIS